MADLLANGIDVYPQKEFDEDSEDRLVNEKFRVSAWCCGLDVFGWVLQLQVLVMSWHSCKVPLFSFQSCCAPVQRVCPGPGSWGLPRTKDPARAQSRDRKRKVPGEGVLSHPCCCSLPQPSSSKAPSATSGQGGPMAPCPAPGTGNTGVCPSLARAAAFPASGGNLPVGCSVFMAVNSLL